MGSPHLEEELIGGDCRSRSPLQKPSKRCKNHRRDGEESSSRETRMEVREKLKNIGKPLGKKGFYSGGRKRVVGRNCCETGAQTG
jgi:hypothetical protein